MIVSAASLDPTWESRPKDRLKNSASSATGSKLSPSMTTGSLPSAMDSRFSTRIPSLPSARTASLP